MRTLSQALCVFAVACSSERTVEDSRPMECAAAEDRKGLSEGQAIAPKAADSAQAQTQALLTDLLAHEACKRIDGSSLALVSKPEDVDEEPAITGRIWVKSCQDEKVGERARVRFEGPAWRWVEGAQEKLGASFEINQYVSFRTNITLTGRVELDYAPEAKVATFWYLPTQPAEVSVNPIGQVQVTTPSAWSKLVGELGALTGEAPREQATQTFERRAEKLFERRLIPGYSIAVDLCTGQVHQKLGQLEAGVLPKAPYPSSEHTWKANGRVRLYPKGLDTAGPFQSDQDLFFATRVDQGKELQAQVVCQSDAYRVVEAFVNDQPLPDVSAVAEWNIASGESKTVKVRPRCPLALMTRPGGGGAEPTVFRFMVYSADAEPNPLVGCPRGDE